jgi:hypothetical protein
MTEWVDYPPEPPPVLIANCRGFDSAGRNRLPYYPLRVVHD